MNPRVKRLLGERQLLLAILIAAVVFHGAALTFLGVKDFTTKAPVSVTPRLRWVSAASRGTAAAVAAMFDPSLGALPNPQGFSAVTWERGVVAQRQPLDFRPLPAFLDDMVTNAPVTLLDEAPLPDVVLAALKKLSAEMEENVGEPIEVPIIANQTVMRVAGAAADWKIVYAPEWPIVSSAKPLLPTRLRAGVEAGGQVRYTSLEASSGNEVVDTQGLELVRQVRFAPLSGSDSSALNWVLVKILWATQLPPPPPPAPATNGKPQAP